MRERPGYSEACRALILKGSPNSFRLDPLVFAERRTSSRPGTCKPVSVTSLQGSLALMCTEEHDVHCRCDGAIRCSMS